MKPFLLASAILLLATGIESRAQDSIYFRKTVTELSSSKFKGRGYAQNGVKKAAGYITEQFRKSGVNEVSSQPFLIDINTFPGKMEMRVDGRRLTPGRDFVMREYSPGAKCSGPLYYIDTLNYNFEKIKSDISREEYRGCYVVCDFWFTYKHSKDFKALQSNGETNNAGVILTWDTPLKFYKAYGEKVADKPIIWVSSDFPKDAASVSLDIENKFLKDYECSNVIAKIEGERHDSCYVFTAHYDHLGNLGRKLYFPGANDNASGVAGILSLARHYAGSKPCFDMYFIAFCGEDANLRGSNHFIGHPTFPLTSIRFLFNLDMIGDDNPVQYCEISDSAVNDFERMVELNADGNWFKALHRGELAANSDHWPFAQKGVPCILFENENGSAFPYYHTAGDNVETMSFATFGPLMKLITSFIGQKDAE